ncbi:MAG: restriction endonuclease PLD domain-containing protein [Candidatus Saccharibacteria bacterium]
MFCEDLFEKILLAPAEAGADELFIISGYASPSLVKRHMASLPQYVKVHLIAGMTGRDGIGRRTHEELKSCVGFNFPGRFECRYMLPPNAVHVKSYSWTKEGRPYKAFTGSVNYTIQAFCSSQLEAASYDSPYDVLQLYKSLESSSIDCCAPEVETLFNIYDELSGYGKSLMAGTSESIDPASLVFSSISNLPAVAISLLDTRGRLPQISGLNWGQRDGRDPNQAYIRIPAEVYRTDFFPDRGIPFILLTDDGNSLNCSTAQETSYGRHGKAVHTYENNSFMGQYFRNRLGIPSGHPVKLEDLLRYGRTHLVFYRIDDTTYYMDFSV